MKIRKPCSTTAQTANPIVDFKDTHRIVQKMIAGGSVTADVANTLYLAATQPQNILHKIKNRSQELDTEIERAKGNATNPADYQCVWIQLIKLAEDKIGPFTGEIHSKCRLQYTNSRNEKAYFSKDALRKRMKPSAR